MEIILKCYKKIFNQDNKINFHYKVSFNENKNGFVNFDIDNELEKINHLLELLDDNKIKQLSLNMPFYYSLSRYFFNEIPDLDSITFENTRFESTINRDDFKI